MANTSIYQHLLNMTSSNVNNCVSLYKKYRDIQVLSTLETSVLTTQELIYEAYISHTVNKEEYHNLTELNKHIFKTILYGVHSNDIENYLNTLVEYINNF